MGLHAIKSEFTFPTHLTEQQLLGVAKFLKEYGGQYPIIISRIPDEQQTSVWYIESEYNPTAFQRFSNSALDSWATDQYYSNNATFSWDDVLVINHPRELVHPLPTKTYVRHD